MICQTATNRIPALCVHRPIINGLLSLSLKDKFISLVLFINQYQLAMQCLLCLLAPYSP